jgi:microcystin-dependent protein
MDTMLGTILTIAFPWAPMGFLACNGQILNVAQYQAVFSLLGYSFGGNGSTTFAIPDLRCRTPIHMGNYVSGGMSVSIGASAGGLSTMLDLRYLPAHNHAAQFNPATGSVPVMIPGTTGNLSVTASLPASTSMGTAAVLPSGEGYLAGLAGSVKVGSSTNPVTMQGPYTTTKPTGATLPADVTVAGSSSVPDRTVSLTMVTGGAVAVLPTAAPTLAVDRFQPSLALNFVIAMEGLYPVRD